MKSKLVIASVLSMMICSVSNTLGLRLPEQEPKIPDVTPAYTIVSRSGDTFVVTVKWPLTEQELKVIGREVMVARKVPRSTVIVRFRDVSDSPKANYKATYEWDFVEDREVGLPEQTRRKIFAEIIGIEDKIAKEIGKDTL